jgi:hypothetical protein
MTLKSIALSLLAVGALALAPAAQAGASSNWKRCGMDPSGNIIRAHRDTSCAFARNVSRELRRQNWRKHITAYSPRAGRWITMHLSGYGEAYMGYRGGGGAAVRIIF